MCVTGFSKNRRTLYATAPSSPLPGPALRAAAPPAQAPRLDSGAVPPPSAGLSGGCPALGHGERHDLFPHLPSLLPVGWKSAGTAAHPAPAAVRPHPYGAAVVLTYHAVCR